MHPLLSRLLPVAALSLALAGSASAVLTVTVSAVPGEPEFRLADGVSAVPDGMHYQLGSFAGGVDTSLAALNPASLFGSWQEFTDGVDDTIFTLGLDGGNAAGDLDGADSFAGMTIYWWVFQTSDGLAPAADFSNVTQHALFTSAAWEFPAVGGVPPVISTADPLDFSAGVLNGGNVQLALVVPEPATASLSLAAVAALLIRRRR